jgi:autophagy-related protein 9
MLIQDVMMYSRRREYVDRLRASFRRASLLSLVSAPFMIIAFLVHFAYSHFSEYHQNPQSIAAHSFTPLARWKLRDFNELPHIYTQRLRGSHSSVLNFLAQFPCEEIRIIMRCASFVTGSVLLVLLLMSLIDADMPVCILGMSKPVLFYAGIVAAVFVAMRSESSSDVVGGSDVGFLKNGAPPPIVEPDEKFEELVKTLRCMPFYWKDMTAKERYEDIRRLFRYKWAIFLPELVSIVTLPVFLAFHCSARSSQIVAFFRENSIHVYDLGIICSCALFSNGQKRMIAVEPQDDDPLERKMQSSIANFRKVYPAEQGAWSPHGETRNGEERFYSPDLPPNRL